MVVIGIMIMPVESMRWPPSPHTHVRTRRRLILTCLPACLQVTLKMMGLSDTTFWSAWTITALLKALFLVTAVVGIACAAGIFQYSAFGLLWIFYMLFGLTCISFAFAVTSLFSKSRTGGAVGMLVYLALAAPAYALTGPSVPVQLKGVLSLLAPCAFNLGNSIITNLEQARVGATVANFGDANATAAGVSLGFLSGMLALDFVLYTLLAVYLDKVVPTEFGSTQHPLFCLGFRRSAATPAAGSSRRGCFGRGGGDASGRKAASLLTQDGVSESTPLAAGAGASGSTHPAAAIAGGAVATASTTPGSRQSVSHAAATASSLLSSVADTEAVPTDVAARPGIVLRGLTKVFPGAWAPTCRRVTAHQLLGCIVCVMLFRPRSPAAASRHLPMHLQASTRRRPEPQSTT